MDIAMKRLIFALCVCACIRQTQRAEACAAAISTHFVERLCPTVDAADKEGCRPDFAVAIYPGHLSLRPIPPAAALRIHADGSRKENNRVIGTVLEYRTKAAAERAAEALRININSTTPRTSVLGMTFGELVTHYIARELDENQQQTRSPKAHSAVQGKSPLSQAVDSSALGKDSLRMWWPETDRSLSSLMESVT
jgi:hypothetical protein